MKQKVSNKGYTLIEIMVTTVIFSLVFGMISGLFALALKAQRRSLASQELLAQTSYVMEYVSRHSRTAQESGVLPGCVAAGAYYEMPYEGAITFIGNESDPCCWEIFLEDGRLEQRKTPPTCSSPDSGSFLTSADLEVEEFNVNLDDSGQPRLTLFLKIKGKGEKAEEQPVIKIQNTISLRSLDVE